jgi:hypothetical protein
MMTHPQTTEVNTEQEQEQEETNVVRRYPNLKQEIHCVKWNLHPQFQRWLAFAGSNGLLRIKMVPS